MPGLQWTSSFFIWAGLVISGVRLPTLLLTLRWFGSAGEGNGGKSSSSNENDISFL